MATISRPFPSRSFFLLSLCLTVVVTFSLGFFIGESKGARSVVPDGEGRLLNQTQTPPYLEKDIDFKQFWNIWNLVKDEFYRQPVSDVDLYYGALKGLVAGLDDPYSVYFDPKEAAEFTANLEGTFEGIGAEIGIKDEKLLIVAPLADMPADQAGLLPGDWIVAIDKTETTGMSVEKAVSLIRGEKGTSVVLTIAREGEDELKDFSIVRNKIVVDSVKWNVDDRQVMTISISTFNHDTSGLFTQAIQEAVEKNVSGIILDLRSNPGGLLTTAIDVASFWVGYDPVVIEKAKEDTRTFKGVMPERVRDIPTVVLVNGGSASASEIVSGALQDYGYATLVGTQTYGKGSVQDYQELPDGSSIKITTAQWYTPKGRTIHKTGISPDVQVSYSLEEYKSGIDPQHDTALAIIFGTYEPIQQDSTQETTSAEDSTTDAQ